MNSIKAGIEEAAHGTLSGGLVGVPCGFTIREQQPNLIPEETRNSQDTAFTVLKGRRWAEWEVGESYVYHDTFGLFLAAALGAPTVAETEAGVVFDNTFKLAADPETLSIQYDDPRRSTAPGQCLYCALDELTIDFAADGTLTYSASGVSMPPTDIASPSMTFSTVKPFEAWRGAVTLDGTASFLRLVSGSVTIKRNRSPFHSIANTQAPQRMSIGKRMVTFELVVDYAATDEMADWRTAKQQGAMTIEWVDTDTTIGASSDPEFGITLGTPVFTDGERDWEPDEPQVKLSGTALYDTSDASSIVAHLQSTVDYTDMAA
jgi:hypothetical protein